MSLEVTYEFLFQADTNRERIEQANIRAKKLIDN